MQVRITHTDPPEWHRPLLDRSLTECGDPIPGYWMERPESYEGNLCKKGCFSPLVLRVAEELKNATAEKRMIEDAKLEAEREEQARQWEIDRAEARERVRRFKTGETTPVGKQETEENEDE